MYTLYHGREKSAIDMEVECLYTSTMVEEPTVIERYTEAKETAQLIRVFHLQAEEGLTIAGACAKIGISRSQFYNLLSKGFLDEYLTVYREGAATGLANMALDKAEEVLQYQIDLASGAKTVRGANPVAAARFVWEVAGLVDRAPTEIQEQINIYGYLPQTVMFDVEGGTPRVTEGGAPRVVEGQYEEVAIED